MAQINWFMVIRYMRIMHMSIYFQMRKIIYSVNNQIITYTSVFLHLLLMHSVYMLDEKLLYLKKLICF